MIFGIVVQPRILVVLGLSAFLVLVVQVLVGYRKIRFKGKKHLVVHKRLAWVLLVIAAIHGFLGFVYGSGIRIG